MTASKLVLSAASGVGGAGLDVDEVFRTTRHEGTASGVTNTVVNGIDLSGEGGLVWVKSMDNTSTSDTYGHILFDTERGTNSILRTQLSSAASTSGYGLQFNNNGWQSGGGWDGISNSSTSFGSPYVSWTFRKAPKFFDIVTYTGNGSNRSIAHSLDSVPGMIIIKRLDNNNPWVIYHRSMGNAGFATFTTDGYAAVSNAFNNTSPTSTHFTLGTRDDVNNSGNTYVAYLFAHNNSDGDFGPNANQDIIKCGDYTGTGTLNEINLGFEPQFIMVKRTNSAGRNDAYRSWAMQDVMRGMTASLGAVSANLSYSRGFNNILWANSSIGEGKRGNISGNAVDAVQWMPTSTGFQVDGGRVECNETYATYIYMAIRRGTLNVPDDATKVYKTVVPTVSKNNASADVPYWTSGFDVDMALHRYNAGSNSIPHLLANRVAGEGQSLRTDSSDTEHTVGNSYSYGSTLLFDYSNGIHTTVGYGAAAGSEDILHMWRRAPGYFDIVNYKGNNNTSTDRVHNLGVVPEMVWIKCRNNTYDWSVYHKDIGVGQASGSNGTGLRLSHDGGLNQGYDSALYQTPTATAFRSFGQNNQTRTYLAFLFATCAGVSKVGSYTGTGSSLNIDCGFGSSSARFVLIKRSDDTGEWFVFNSARGITSNADPYLVLDSSNGENSIANRDIGTYSGGFTVTGTHSGVNASGGTYIFYAIA